MNLNGKGDKSARFEKLRQDSSSTESLHGEAITEDFTEPRRESWANGDLLMDFAEDADMNEVERVSRELAFFQKGFDVWL
jgi:hypothetical protein